MVLTESAILPTPTLCSALHLIPAPSSPFTGFLNNFTYHSRSPLRLNIVDASALPHTRREDVRVPEDDHAHK